MKSNLLIMKNISKSFGSNKVLDCVQLKLDEGEVLAVLGENGAGKSTLMKILNGIYKKDEGEIFINDKKVEINSVDEATKLGVSIIHQELMLAQNISVAENIYMGKEIVNKFGFINLEKQSSRAKEMLSKFQINIDPNKKIKELTIAEQQMVEIVRAVSFGAKIVVMDEPTSSLTNQEVGLLYEMIVKLKEQHVGIIYISHKLNELYDIADNVTILRDGKYIDTVAINETQRNSLVSMMVGREISKFYHKTNEARNEIVLEVKNLSDGKKAKNVSFDLKKSEILGVAGLVGAGRTETMKAIFGITKKSAGTIKIENKEVSFATPKEAIDFGMGMIPEDRKSEGLFLQQDIKYNLTATILDKIFKFLSLDSKKEDEIVDEKMKEMAVKAVSKYQNISQLSGGNQQKVLIGRWLLSTKKILILDEPTRGVDVKSKAEIYELIDKVANQGISIIMISSELPELINMCDRILVLNDGISTGILKQQEFDQELIMTMATR